MAGSYFLICTAAENGTITNRLETITVLHMNSAVFLDKTVCSTVDMYLPKVCDPATKLHDVIFLKNTVFSRIIRSILSAS